MSMAISLAIVHPTDYVTKETEEIMKNLTIRTKSSLTSYTSKMTLRKELDRANRSPHNHSLL